MKTINVPQFVCGLGVSLFAIFIQIQVTLLASENYLGLRVNCADFILPIAGVTILLSILFKRASWPQWQKPFGYWAPILLTCVIAFSLLNGYRLLGHWSSWAVFNKSFGWVILISYLGLGAWLTTNYQQLIRKWFITPFVLFFGACLISEIIVRILFQQHVIEHFTILDALETPNLRGFMGNRNAFAFLYLSILSISSILLTSDTRLSRIENYCFKALWAIVPLFFVMNASRSFLLAVSILVVFLCIRNWRFFLFKILPLLLISACLIPAVNTKKFKKAIFHSNQLTIQGSKLLSEDNLRDEIVPNDFKDKIYKGDKIRVEVISDGISLYKAHPFTGAGLGAILDHQNKEARANKSTMDNTALWMLVEMGPFGLIAFVSAFIAILVSLYRKSKECSDYESTLALGLIYVMGCFAIFSLFHEILYSRFLWVFLGIGLAVPRLKTHQD